MLCEILSPLSPLIVPRCETRTVPYTLGFPTALERALKFNKHVTLGREFAYASAEEYEANADRFLGEPLVNNTTEECIRTKRDGTIGDKIRYNGATQEFGVLGNDNVIRSYFVPDPARHGMGTNLNYFYDACHQVRG